MATIRLANAGEPNAAELNAVARAIAAGTLQAGMLHAGELHAGNGDAREVVSSGFRLLDGLLPAGGVRRGSLVEWLGADEASGAAALAFAIACRLAGTIIVVDRWGRFHPPAVMPWLGGRQLVVARPSRDEDEVWAIDQSLRCPGVAAVLAWPGLACSGRIHATAMRRWQLAARASHAVGLFVRPDAARREPSWAEARVAVSAVPGEQPAARRLRLTLAGGPWSGIEVEQERAVEVVLDLVRGCEGAPGRRWSNPRERAGQMADGECPAHSRAARPPRLFQSAGRQSAGRQSAGRQSGGRSCRAS